mgnify:FL=1
MLRTGVRSIYRVIMVSDARIHISSLWVGYEVFIDKIRITAGRETDFIVTPYIRRLSPSLVYTLPVAYRLLNIPSSNSRLFKPLTGYVSISNTPQYDKKTNKNNVVTAALTLASDPGGVFENGVFRALGPYATGALVLGSFTHQYTEAGVDKSIVLTMLNDGRIRYGDTATLVPTIGGVAVLGTGIITYDVSADGRAVVMEFEVPSTPSGAVSKKFRLDVDLAAAPQVVASEIVHAPQYGATTGVSSSTGSGGNTYAETTNTSSATYPATYGVAATGATVITEIVETLYLHGTAANSEVVGPPLLRTAAATYEIEDQLILQLPNGNAKTLVTRSEIASLYKEVTDHIYTASVFTRNAWTGVVNIVYSDPAVPVLIYEIVRSFTTDVGAAEIIPPTSDTGSRTTYANREVGILIGTTQRVLFTDISTPVVATVSNPYPLTNEKYFTASAAANADITAIPAGYIKPLRRVHTTTPAFTTGYLGAKYVVDIKSRYEWLVGVTKPLTMDGAATNEFTIYSSDLAEAKLKQKFVGYLAEALATVDAVAAADMVSGNLSPYEIRLSSADLGSFI